MRRSIARPDLRCRLSGLGRCPPWSASSRSPWSGNRPERPRHRGATMCGIAGFVEASSTAAAPFGADDRARWSHRMCDVIRHRGPDDEGVLVEPGVGLGHAAPEHHRPRRPATSRSTTRTAPSGRLQRRDLQLPRAARASSRRPGTASTRHRHRGDRPRLRAVGRRGVRAAARDVRVRALGHAARARCSSRAIASGIKPLYYAERRAAACSSAPR